ncbi:hypothetical protein JCM21900_004598 [Sporobolomyces salmonicolor]
MQFLLLVLPALAGLAAAQLHPILTSTQLRKDTPALPLGLYRHLRRTEAAAAAAQTSPEPSYLLGLADQLPFSASPPSTARPSSRRYPAHAFDQLVSHDPLVPPPSPDATFEQRYWYDATFYKPGGPVFLLDGGETSGEDRIPFLEKGILRVLSEATGGIGVVLEHRFYGESFPVDTLSTDNLRFLTTLQALEDSNYFAKNVIFPGLGHLNLTAPGTAWVRYGGSYAGAASAFARKLFPDIWWGAIASSAVTTAIVDFSDYYIPIRQSGPPQCISQLQNHTATIDSLLALKHSLVTSSLKAYFGLPNVTDDADFVNALSLPLSSWQARNWDPAVGSSTFFRFCDALTNTTTTPSLSIDSATGSLLSYLLPHWPTNPRKQLAAFASYASFIKEHVAALCPDGAEQDECFGTDVYEGDGLEEAGWKSWSYQFCTEWGYFIGAPPNGKSTIVSRLLTPEYTGQICKKAFPPGELNQVPAEPNVTAINQWGSFDLSHHRLAFIDGSEDPWLYATPHSPRAPNPHRKDTRKKPFKLIPGGVHHWDENGLVPSSAEPYEIQQIHRDEVEFVQAWMRQWKERGRWKIEH